MPKSLYLLAALFPTQLLAGDLVFSIDNLNNSNGQVVVWVYAEEQAAAYPSDGSQAICKQIVPISDALPPYTASCTNLHDGNYAAFLFHDENSNDEPDHNFIGFPKEQMGFSNGCTPGLPIPSFDKCFVHLQDTDLTIPVAMKSFF